MYYTPFDHFNLSGFSGQVPFPYDPARMPSCPPELKGTWIESNLNNYPNDGTAKKVKELIDIAVNFKNSHDVPMFCGEFGVYMPNSDEPDRVRWYDTVSSYLEEKEIAWTIWDYTGGFGIFKEGSEAMFEHDVNIPLSEALGLNVPQRSELIIHPDSTGFKIYSDYIEEKITGSSWAGDFLRYKIMTKKNNTAYFGNNTQYYSPKSTAFYKQYEVGN